MPYATHCELWEVNEHLHMMSPLNHDGSFAVLFRVKRSVLLQ